MLIVCGTKAGIVPPEEALERVVQHGCPDVEERLHRRPVPAHLLPLVHAPGHDLVQLARAPIAEHHECIWARPNIDAGGEFDDELAPAVVTVQDLMQE